MGLVRGRRAEPINYWPSFVDALSTMLLVIIFLLSVFMLAQYYLSREVSGKDSALEKLNKQIEELSTLLAMERSQNSSDQEQIAHLTATLAKTKASETGTGGTPGGLAQVDALNAQILALRRQLAAVQEALDISQSSEKEAKEKIADLGQRLNVALARKVEELARYRSDFFGRLRQILGDRPDIAIVGDRFVFSSSVLFETGKADISAQGQASLSHLAEAVQDLAQQIPPDILWVLRIDGHTDIKPVSGPIYKSNWELSSARAIAVVKFLINHGVDPHNLAATGFGEFQPLDPAHTEAAYTKNRRIELKLTER